MRQICQGACRANSRTSKHRCRRARTNAVACPKNGNHAAADRRFLFLLGLERSFNAVSDFFGCCRERIVIRRAGPFELMIENDGALTTEQN